MKKLAQNHTYEYLKATYFVRFLADAFFYTFLYVFLTSQGFSTGQSGIVSALSPLAALIGNIIFQKLAKNLDVNRTLMVIFGVIEMSAALLFGTITNQPFLYYAIVVTFVSLFNGPYYSLLDGYSGTYISQRNKQYSSMRLMGTISYVIGPFVGGLIIGKTPIGYNTLFVMSALFFFLATIMTFFLPKQKVEITRDVSPEERTKIKLKKHPDLIIYLIFCFFVMSLSSVSDNFFSIYLTNVRGLSTAEYGYLISATIFLEAIAFVFIIFRKNMFRNPTFAFLFMGLLVITRPLSVALNLPLPFVYILAVLRGIAWAYYLVFNVKFLARIIPLKHLTKALFIVSISLTLGRIIASLSVGELLKTISYPVVFSFIAGLMAMGTLLSAILSEMNKRNQKKAEKPALISELQ